jgi:hypothetical protein
MFYSTVGTANSADTRIYHENHSAVIDGRIPTRAGLRALPRTEKDLARG